MKILVVLSRVPYPLEKGDKLRAYHQIKRLAERHEIILCCLSDRAVSAEAQEVLKPLCTQLHVVGMSRLAIAKRLFFGLFSSKPYQVHYFHDKRMARLLGQVVERSAVDHIYCQLVRCAEMVRGIDSVSKTIDYMDALSIGMERRIDGSSGIKKRFVQAEYRRLRRYEKAVYPDFDSHTIISTEDREALGAPGAVHVIANGVDLDYFAPRQGERSVDMVFVGNLSYAPNVDCVRYLVQDVMPRIQALRPEASLLIAGADPNKEVQSLCTATGVELTGWVEDIRDAYASAAIFVAPMRIGTGLQNKLLEALAMEIPAVTSSLANAALGGRHGENILVADTADEVAEAALRLLTDADLAARSARAGRQFVENNYSWESAVARLEEVMTHRNTLAQDKD